jgi:hypothetical protein
MPASGNFTTIILGPDDSGTVKLMVNGESLEPDVVTAVYVAVAHAEAKRTLLGATEPGTLPSTAVVAPDGASGWTAILDQDDPPYQEGETVLAVGVMVGGEKDAPFFWHQALEIQGG